MICCSPRAHLFGHAHRGGMIIQNGILFSNAACSLTSGKPNVIDFYVNPKKKPIMELYKVPKLPKTTQAVFEGKKGKHWQSWDVL